MDPAISITEDIIDVALYFRILGYQVSSHFIIDFFSCLSRLPKKERDARHEIYDYMDILKVILVKNKEEFYSFPHDFEAFLKRARIVDIKEYQNIQECEKDFQYTLNKEQKNVQLYLIKVNEAKQYLEEMQRFTSSNTLFNEREIKDIKRLMKKKGEELSSLVGMSLQKMSSLYEKRPTEKELMTYQKKLQKGITEIVMSDSYQDLLPLMKQLMKMVNLARQRLANVSPKQIKEAKQNYKYYQQLYQESIKRIAEAQQLIERVIVKKDQSFSHRFTFQGGSRFVSSNEQALLTKNIEELKEPDFIRIKDYLRDHATAFRTRLSRHIQVSSSHLIDFQKTCCKATRMGGIPISLMKVKPKKKKVSIVLFLDVSGSCHNAAKMMLLFVQMMKDVFGGGCYCFAIVNRLYDITKSFEEGEEITTILNCIPTRGAYSNYEFPLRQFCNEKLFLITHDTIVIFIGDMRNNQNSTGEE